MFSNLPAQFQANFDSLQSSDQYGRLIETVAQWFSLIELCEDLVERIQLYGIFNYLSGDEEYVKEKLKQNWKIIDQEDQSKEKKVVQAKGYASSAMSYVFNQAGQFLQQLGVFGCAHAAFSRYCWGFATVHPGYFMSAILTSVLVKMKADTLQQNNVLNEIDLVTEHFRLVTSNLMNQYKAGSKAVHDFFVDQNIQRVQQTINDLIDGQNKSNQGTLQKFFDERDLELEKIKVNDLRNSEMTESWVEIEK